MTPAMSTAFTATAVPATATSASAADIGQYSSLSATTRANMAYLRITPDSWVYRSVDAKFVTPDLTLIPNPDSVAAVRMTIDGPTLQAKDLERPGLNVSTVPSRYHSWQPGLALTRFKLSEALSRGGEVLLDTGGLQTGVAAYITVPAETRIPVQVIPNQHRPLMEKLIQTYGQEYLSGSSSELLALRRALEAQLDSICSQSTISDAFPRRSGAYTIIEGNSPIGGGVFSVTPQRQIRCDGHQPLRCPQYMRDFTEYAQSVLRVSAVQPEPLFEAALEFARKQIPQPPSLKDLLFDAAFAPRLSKIAERGRGTELDRLLLAASCLEYVMAPGNNVLYAELRVDTDTATQTVSLSLRTPQMVLPLTHQAPLQVNASKVTKTMMMLGSRIARGVSSVLS